MFGLWCFTLLPVVQRTCPLNLTRTTPKNQRPFGSRSSQPACPPLGLNKHPVWLVSRAVTQWWPILPLNREWRAHIYGLRVDWPWCLEFNYHRQLDPKHWQMGLCLTYFVKYPSPETLLLEQVQCIGFWGYRTCHPPSSNRDKDFTPGTLWLLNPTEGLKLILDLNK